MKCRIWKKLHAEEARRFDQAYSLLEKHPEIDLADAFGIIQSGRSVEEFLAKKARGKVKEEIQEAREAIPTDAIDGFLNGVKDRREDLAIVLGDRTLIDKLVEIQPVALVFERAGRVEKLQVTVLGRKEQWEKLSSTLERDPKLMRKPVAVQRQPDRRPIADPRVFVPQVGKRLRFELRNGIMLVERLAALGPYDVLVGAQGAELFVPLHAMLRWSEADPVATS